jgi:stearoyl-CoA desaturase (delta-9 desaturase)
MSAEAFTSNRKQKFPAKAFELNWANAGLFILLHLACFSVVWVGFSWVAFGICVAMYLVRMFALSAFYHRLFAHRAYQTSRTMQFVFAILGNTALQRGPLWWAATHRHHHQYSDTPEDVHSPLYGGFWLSHVGWIFHRANEGTREALIKDLMRYPELVFLDKFDWLVPLLTAAALYGLGYWLTIVAPHYGASASQILVWGFIISTVALFHASVTINSLAHVWGGRRYETQDQSRNNFVLSLLTLGEGWHNNHHRFPTRVKLGIAWWEIDVTYLLLRGLAFSGLIWNLRDRDPSGSLNAKSVV